MAELPKEKTDGMLGRLFLGPESNGFSGKPKEVMHTMKINLFNRGDPNY
jgi:hypothetical protein